MGDRALIQIEGEHGVGPGVYVHWGGYMVRDLIDELIEKMGDRVGDVGYTSARLVEIACAGSPGCTGVGVGNFQDRLKESDSPGDAGCFVVNCETWKVDTFGGYGFNTVDDDDE